MASRIELDTRPVRGAAQIAQDIRTGRLGEKSIRKTWFVRRAVGRS